MSRSQDMAHAELSNDKKHQIEKNEKKKKKRSQTLKFFCVYRNINFCSLFV